MKITTEKKNGGMKVSITLNFRIPGILKMIGGKLSSCYENLAGKIKNEFSGSEIIFTKTKTRGEFAFYSWEENPHKLRMKAIRQMKKAPAMAVFAILVFQVLGFGLLIAPEITKADTVNPIFYDDFEDHDLDGWDTNSAFVVNKPNKPCEGSYSAGIMGDGSYLIKSLNTSGYENIVLSYQAKKKPFSQANYTFKTAWRIGDSGEWNFLEEITSTLCSCSSHTYQLPSEVNNQAEIEIKFYLKNAENYDSGYIDEVSVVSMDCDDGIECTIDSCVDGQCQHDTSACECNQNADCDDGLWCNGTEICNLNTYECESGTPPNCDDGINCTDDSCDEDNDQCVNVPNDANCLTDEWVDTGNTQWVSSGSCTEKEQKEQEYRDHYCDADLDCQYTATDFQWVDTGATRDKQDGTLCDDGDACTENNICSNGICSGTPIDCDDGDLCTTDVCVDGECVHTPIDCDDGDLCTTDVCVNGECVYTPIDCDDGNVCTNDSCDPGIGCVNAPNSNQCDDGDACTENNICSNGICSGTPIDCDDGDLCTTDVCVDGECVHTPIDCDDGDLCTTDVCVNGECVYTPIDCDDGNVCTNDSCDPGIGCVNAPNSNQCDDGDACTENNICSNGICSGTPIDCDDGDLCTTDVCVDGECVHTPIDCDDGIECTIDSCVDGECQHDDSNCPNGENELLGSISGYKFNDANNNSVWDTEENGLSEWGITLYSGETELLTAITDEDGYYQFSDLALESYTVKESLKSGWTQTYPVDPNNYYEIELSAGNENSEDNNFGNYKEPESGGTSSGGFSPPRKYPDMSITKTDGQETADPEQILEYSITCFNIGDAEAKDVEVIDILPDFVNFISASDGGTYDSEKNQVVWNLGNILAGISKILNLQVKVFSETPAEGTALTNKVEIKTSSDDLDLSNNQDEDITNIGAVKGAEDKPAEEPEGKIEGEEIEILPKAGPDISLICLLTLAIFGIMLKAKRLIAF